MKKAESGKAVRAMKKYYALRHITADNHVETKNIRCCFFHQAANLIEFEEVYQMFFEIN